MDSQALPRDHSADLGLHAAAQLARLVCETAPPSPLRIQAGIPPRQRPRTPPSHERLVPHRALGRDAEFSGARILWICAEISGQLVVGAVPALGKTSCLPRPPAPYRRHRTPGLDAVSPASSRPKPA